MLSILGEAGHQTHELEGLVTTEATGAETRPSPSPTGLAAGPAGPLCLSVPLPVKEPWVEAALRV